MLQGSDPFDEFRMKKEIERLEKNFRQNADQKRKRLRELLEEDAGDPDEVEARVQDEMESFFRESAKAAESVFTQVDGGAAAGREEIQQRLDEVLQAVETRPAVRPTARPLSPSATAGPAEEEEVQDALERIRRHTTGTSAPRPPGAAPDWLDVTEETVDDVTVERDEDRRKRILGAFDQSLDRFRSLIREHARERVEVVEEGAADPPLSPRREAGGFVAVAERAEAEPVAEATLESRVTALEREVARLRRVLARHGLDGEGA